MTTAGRDVDGRTADRGVTVQVANDRRCVLGEGPVWDPVRRRVMWVDISNGLILSGTLHDDGTVSTDDEVAVGGTVGAVAVSPSGEWVIAGTDGLLFRRPGGEIVAGPRIVDDATVRRLNDGKPDPAGDFVVGTLALDDAAAGLERLVRVDGAGLVHPIDDDLTLSNGLAWSRDGDVMYSVDTLRRVVYARQYRPGVGPTGARRDHLRFENGFPDGMCIDAEGCLWIAMWGLGEVRRYSPVGDLLSVVHVPAPHVSSVAFAGDDLNTLLITTATEDLDEADIVTYPMSGCLFTIKPGVRGLHQPLWNGVVATTPRKARSR
ncbi:SMP-30/gluconolactonase/LRE family protein [Dactylosporangium fulvum]|uniref:SMP-30/gluconolactonase/LRE family protein n=1 Tax=Dactylosporangium fulvum TaxID=53359 RepID=A0ABY5W9A4_9ACTN|nr:SMP-30/gluconolactonase/LRE family protein [Dactylosporangium fulvum]UWP86613.1 SMP-30/gluconolactonase/LRE family protein [Dactylosporangium fulvum]